MIKQFSIVVISLFLTAPAMAAGGDVELQKRDWSFSGPFGTFDKAAMQRGFQAYREVCAGCHGMKLIAFRNFADLGLTMMRSRRLQPNMKCRTARMTMAKCLCVPVLLRTVFHLPMPMTMQHVPAIMVPCHPICH